MTKKEDKPLVPRIPDSGRKRLKINWEKLFEMWCETELTVYQFLNGFQDCSPYNGHVKRATKDWTNTARKAHKEKKRIETEKFGKTVATGLGLWDTIKGWRKEQASADFNTADALRTHLKLLLNQTIGTDKVTGKTITLMKATELKAVSEALLNVQKVQRLSLGLSTDNIGVEMPDVGSHVDKPTGEEVEYPTFVVEVNEETGKFRRSRPRQIS